MYSASGGRQQDSTAISYSVVIIVNVGNMLQVFAQDDKMPRHWRRGEGRGITHRHDEPALSLGRGTEEHAK